MKKLIGILLIVFWSTSFAQVTPSSIIRVANATTAFNETVAAGKNIVNNGTGKQYLVLLPLANTKTIATCTLGTDIKELIGWTSLSSTATGFTYTNTTGVFSLTSGYIIPTTTEQTNWGSAYTDTQAAASANTASTIVKRDASGDFSAHNIAATSYCGPSDSTLKRRIRPFTQTDFFNASKIDFRKFIYRADSTNQERFGPIAQEVQKFIPQVVLNNKETGKLEIEHIDLLYILIAQQKDANEKLEKRVKSLEKSRRNHY